MIPSDNYGSMGPINLTASTLVVEPNSSYFCHIHIGSTSAPMGGSTMGLLMILSTLQYQAPYVNSLYSGAMAQAGKAAFMESGGQSTQDKILDISTKKATNIVHSLGITDTEIGIVLGSAKIIKEKQFSVNGPKLGFINTHLTATQNSGNLGLGWNW